MACWLIQRDSFPLRTRPSASFSKQQIAPNNTYSFFRGNVLLQNLYMTACLFFVQSMASKSYESGFKKYYGNRLDNISNETTEGEIKRIYDDWAGEYEEVILISMHDNIPGNRGAAGRDTAIFSGRFNFKSGKGLPQLLT